MLKMKKVWVIFKSAWFVLSENEFYSYSLFSEIYGCQTRMIGTHRMVFHDEINEHSPVWFTTDLDNPVIYTVNTVNSSLLWLNTDTEESGSIALKDLDKATHLDSDIVRFVKQEMLFQINSLVAKQNIYGTPTTKENNFKIMNMDTESGLRNVLAHKPLSAYALHKLLSSDLTGVTLQSIKKLGYLEGAYAFNEDGIGQYFVTCADILSIANYYEIDLNSDFESEVHKRIASDSKFIERALIGHGLYVEPIQKNFSKLGYTKVFNNDIYKSLNILDQIRLFVMSSSGGIRIEYLEHLDLFYLDSNNLIIRIHGYELPLRLNHVVLNFADIAVRYLIEMLQIRKTFYLHKPQGYKYHLVPCITEDCSPDMAFILGVLSTVKDTVIINDCIQYDAVANF